MNVAVDTEWIHRTPDSATVDALSETLDCSELVATVLANREITTPDVAREFLDPSPKAITHPRHLPDIDPAVGRLEQAVGGEERIVVYADRDIDGISGAAILVSLLRTLDAPVEYYVPGKWDGYGLSTDAVDDLAAAGGGVLLTVDCGTTAIDPIERARSNGFDVVVTDHHQPDAELPVCTACINPRRADSAYPNESLAGGAVAFKLGQALVEAIAPQRIEQYHRNALPLAAVATLGDYMPLHVENRALVHEGFARLYESQVTGLVRTATHCDVESIGDMGRSLVPLLNAGQEAESGEFTLELLLASDSEEIDAGIADLEEHSETRKQQRRDRQAHLETCFDAQMDPDDAELFFIETDQYVGTVPAMRLSETWGRPVVTYRRKVDHYQGGGRSDQDIDFLDLFEACSEHLEEFWGHPGAAGFRVLEPSLGSFKRSLVEALRDQYDPSEFRPSIEIDDIVEPADIDRQLIEDLDRLQPFGNGNEEPVILVEGVTVTDYEVFGADDTHCRLVPAETDAFIGTYWEAAAEIEEVVHPATYDLVGTLGIDEYRDQPSLTVSDHRVTG